MLKEVMKMVFKKKLDEKKMVKWVNKSLEDGSDLEQIGKVLTKKYNKKDVDNFLTKNFGVEPEPKEDKELESGLEEEKKKKEVEDELDQEIKDLKVEAGGKEPEEIIAPEEVPEAPKETKGKEKEVPIQRMSSYDIELLNQIASINQGIMKIIELLGKKQ